MASTLKYEDEIVRIVFDRGLCVIRWADSPLARHFPLVTDAMKRAAADASDGKAAMLNVVDAPGKVPRFDDAVRKAAAQMTTELTPISHGVAHVILLDGFTGAAVRMFLSTLTLLSRGRAPTTVHAQVTSGAAWLAGHAPGWSASRIEAVYASARG